MGKKLRIAGVGCLVVLLAIASGFYGLYRAAQQVPAFYQEALQADPAVQRKASDQMLDQVIALHNSVRRPGPWEATFTDQQINGWLAVDLIENHPGLLPASLQAPRVAIAPDGITVACRFQQGSVNSVVTITVEPYLQEPNLLALRIHKARAGLLPLPLGNLLDRVSQAAAKAELDVRWRKAEGDPVALVRLPPPSARKQAKEIRIETLELREGEIYVSGTTERKK